MSKRINWIHFLLGLILNLVESIELLKCTEVGLFVVIVID
nr:MAG TPA: hypothetical protein [Microviridae sp.]